MRREEDDGAQEPAVEEVPAEEERKRIDEDERVGREGHFIQTLAEHADAVLLPAELLGRKIPVVLQGIVRDVAHVFEIEPAVGGLVPGSVSR